jgi:glyoxylase-like metal-dependent hydrolase (beta-lactamase superfamily II)/rhodanese-related sulfurtransferase
MAKDMPSRVLCAILLVPMYFKQFYLGCLAQASYLIGSEGEAVVVDPRRDVDEYLAAAEEQGLRIGWVIETHLHADFVSGHRELAERTGAQIVFGARAGAAFPHLAVHHGQELRLGRVVLRFLETPGHTPESVSVLVIDTDASPEPRMVLTGDTLFIGDVGRPDLVGAQGHTPEEMAGLLFDSLHERLLTLPDHVEVFPAHGAGSLCGRNISKETSSTIGEQRRSNYALQPMAREQFVRMMTTDLPQAPGYFARDAALNREGAAPLADHSRPRGLSPAEVAQHVQAGAVVLDVRGAAAFGAGHVPGALNVGLGGQFASWAGTLVDAARPIVIVADDAAGVEEAVVRLARVGLENLAGYLEDGLAAWDRDGRTIAHLPQIAVDELKAQIDERGDALQLLDVRRPAEYLAGHVPGAANLPLDRLPAALGTVDASRPTAVLCAGGYRSSAASSLLQRNGFHDLQNVVGGTAAWIAAGYPLDIDRT